MSSASVPAGSQADPGLLKRREVVDALRRGTVPRSGLELFAVGLGDFQEAIDEELEAAALGRGVLKAVRGEYGAGKTFFARWLEHRARQRGFATASVQISKDVLLHELQTVYRRAIESLQTREWSEGAFRSLLDRWIYELEEEAIGGDVDPDDDAAISTAVTSLLEQRLSRVSATYPLFATVLREYYQARMRGDSTGAEGLLAWLMGDKHVGAATKRKAGIAGSLDDRGARGFLRGLLALVRQTGRKGLVLVLDELETIQRMRSDIREHSLRGLRQLVDDIDAGAFPGLYVLITGTPQFFEGPQGLRRAAAAYQRLAVDFSGPSKHYNPKAPQIRLMPFDRDKLLLVGKRVREIYPAKKPERIAAKVTDEVLMALADGVAGELGGEVGVAPRLYLRKLVLDVLDKVDLFEDYDPTKYKFVVDALELKDEERAAAGVARDVDDIALDLD